MMDAARLLVTICVVVSTSECSDPAEPKCKDYNEKYPVYHLEGEALYYKHYAVVDEKITWYKNNIRIEDDSVSNETRRIHFDGGTILFRDLLVEDTGLYTGRSVDASGKCSNFNINIIVLATSERANPNLLYGQVNSSKRNEKLTCPHPVTKTCKKFRGNFTWYKDFGHLQGEHKEILWVSVTSKHVEGIYTCFCTWTDGVNVYNSSGSRKLFTTEPSIYKELEILSPTSTNPSADKGVRLRLNCTIFCGINVKDGCHAHWLVNGAQVTQMNGYSESTDLVTERLSLRTMATAVLTIEKVSAKDFQHEFNCSGQSVFDIISVAFHLNQRESLFPLVAVAVAVFLLCVFAAVLLKVFAVDLALLFRPCFPVNRCNKDARLYDAYVAFQTQGLDKGAEDTLCRFVTQVLPSVLEEKCGYRLFIKGRDDIPGEDHVEQVEDCMRQSRRLMVILSPGSGSGSDNTDQQPSSLTEGFDWQVGLHDVLVQREMSMILIQLGDTGPQGYKHLPIGLQHLISKSAPLRWSEGSRVAAAANSRFWKRVRYLMPATPARKCLQSPVI